MQKNCFKLQRYTTMCINIVFSEDEDRYHNYSRFRRPVTVMRIQYTVVVGVLKFSSIRASFSFFQLNGT